MRYAHINTTDKALLYETWVNGMYFSKREQYFESVGRDYKLDEKIMPMPGQKVVKFYNEDFLDHNQRNVFAKQVTDDKSEEKSIVGNNAPQIQR